MAAPALSAKIACLVLFAVITLVCGLLPLLFSRLARRWSSKISPGNNRWRKRSELLVSCIMCLGGGVLLATIFTHMLPEIREVFEEAEALDILPDIGLPMGEMILCFGFFMVFFIEEVAHACMSHDRRRKHRKNQKRDTERGLDNAAADVTEEGKENETPSESSSDRDQDHRNHDHATDIVSQKSFRAYLVVVALSVHSVFEGLAVGFEETPRQVWVLFSALLAHKVVVAFCIGQQLLGTKRSVCFIISTFSVFAFASPLGVGLGIAISDSVMSGGSLLATGVLQSLAAGTILYVIFFELLGPELQKRRWGLAKFFAALLGFGLMLLLHLTGGHSHSHGDHSSAVGVHQHDHHGHGHEGHNHAAHGGAGGLHGSAVETIRDIEERVNLDRVLGHDHYHHADEHSHAQNSGHDHSDHSEHDHFEDDHSDHHHDDSDHHDHTDHDGHDYSDHHDAIDSGHADHNSLKSHSHESSSQKEHNHADRDHRGHDHSNHPAHEHNEHKQHPGSSRGHDHQEHDHHDHSEYGHTDHNDHDHKDHTEQSHASDSENPSAEWSQRSGSDHLKLNQTVPDHTDHTGHDHSEHDHPAEHMSADQNDHAGHDHSQHDHTDHTGHDHSEHDHPAEHMTADQNDHSGHDHSQHDHTDHTGHDHSEHDHPAEHMSADQNDHSGHDSQHDHTDHAGHVHSMAQHLNSSDLSEGVSSGSSDHDHAVHNQSSYSSNSVQAEHDHPRHSGHDHPEHDGSDSAHRHTEQSGSLSHEQGLRDGRSEQAHAQNIDFNLTASNVTMKDELKYDLLEQDQFNEGHSATPQNGTAEEENVSQPQHAVQTPRFPGSAATTPASHEQHNHFEPERSAPDNDVKGPLMTTRENPSDHEKSSGAESQITDRSEDVSREHDLSSKE